MTEICEKVRNCKVGRTVYVNKGEVVVPASQDSYEAFERLGVGIGKRK